MQIARFWPLGLHHGCRCRQVPVKPGQVAPHPFIDYQKEVKALAPDQQAAVMGRSLFRLWDKGVIRWEDAVTPSRVRSLQEVVGRQRLSIKTLIKAGVRPDIAKAAHAAVHTPEHEAAEAHRRGLIERIHAAGVNHDLVVKHIGERLASRVDVAAGPGYTTKAGEVLPGIPARQLIDPAEQRRRQADELSALLGSAAGVAGAVAAMRRKKRREEDEVRDEPWKPLKPVE